MIWASRGSLRASGISEAPGIFKHGLRNAALPVVTVLGGVMVAVLAVAVFVERVFVLPGCTLYFALMSVVINLLVDLSYGWLNPKVRVD